MNIDDIRGSVARGWCQPETSSKVMDPDLAEAIAQQVHSDLSSPLGAVAMREAAIAEVDCGGCYGKCVDPANCRLDDVAAIRAIPLPTHAALLAAALALPEVAALVGALLAAKDSLWFAERELRHAGCVPEEDCDLMKDRIDAISAVLEAHQ